MIYHHSNIENLAEWAWNGDFSGWNCELGDVTDWTNSDIVLWGCPKKKVGQTREKPINPAVSNFIFLINMAIFEISSALRHPHIWMSIAEQRDEANLQNLEISLISPMKMLGRSEQANYGQTLPDFMIFSWIMKYQWDFCRIFMTPVDGSATAESSVTLRWPWPLGHGIPKFKVTYQKNHEKSEMDDSEFYHQKIHLMARVHHLHRWASLVPSCKEALQVGNLAWTVGLIMGIKHDTTIV